MKYGNTSGKVVSNSQVKSFTKLMEATQSYRKMREVGRGCRQQKAI